MDEPGIEAHERLLQKIHDALEDKPRSDALYLATENIRELTENVYSEMEDSEALLQQARRIKREAISRLDEHLGRFIQAAESAGVKVHLERDAESAVRQVLELARGARARLIVKAKSMTGEEISLRHRLEREGFDVVETDLGERIVQLANHRPSHVVLPAIHMHVEEIAELFSKHYGKEIPPEPEWLTAMARESLREKLLDADIGITGANFALAESGALVIVSNEGNARVVTALPPLNIAVIGLEKIVAGTTDALTLLQALTASATGQRLSSYVTIMKGRSTPAAPGRQPELHVVILDNGRSTMRADPLVREALYCLRCGACMDVCPTFRLLGGHVFGHIYTGPIGIPWTAYTATLESAGEFAPLCISCGLCKHACPEDIDIPFLIAKVKQRYMERHGQLPINRTLCSYETFVNFAGATSPLSGFFLGKRTFRRVLERTLQLDARRPFPKFTRSTFKKWFKSHVRTGSEGRRVAYFIDTYADQCEPEIGQGVVGILESNDCAVELPKQVGSGMPAFLYGDIERTRRTAIFNVLHFAEIVRAGSEIVSSEPTATYCLKQLYPKLLGSAEADLVAAHSHDVFDYLLELQSESRLREGFPSIRVGPAAYYAPCHTRGLYGRSPALEVMKQTGMDIQPVKYDTCCGIAGTFGFKKGIEGYDVSMAIGERLFQRIRAMNVDLVVTESSVCKMQIEHGTSIRVVHPAIMLWDAYRPGTIRPQGRL